MTWSLVSVAVLIFANAAVAQAPGEVMPPCGLTGSSSVTVEGGRMLRLSDVIGCEGVLYEPIPGLFIEGEPAVRLVPKAESGCVATGAASVVVEGEAAHRQGDIHCP